MDVTVSEERESGSECTAVTRLRIQNGRQRRRKGNDFLPAMHPDDHYYVLVGAGSNWYGIN